MAKWKVNDGYSVPFGDGDPKVGGDTFEATQAEIDAAGAGPYVTEVKAKAKAEAPNKARATAPDKGK